MFCRLTLFASAALLLAGCLTVCGCSSKNDGDKMQMQSGNMSDGKAGSDRMQGGDMMSHDKMMADDKLSADNKMSDGKMTDGKMVDGKAMSK